MFKPTFENWEKALMDEPVDILLDDVEDWSEHPDDDRRGLYLYAGNEIAYFVALVRKTGDNFIVKSNVTFK